jgi:hypothetical protein
MSGFDGSGFGEERVGAGSGDERGFRQARRPWCKVRG